MNKLKKKNRLKLAALFMAVIVAALAGCNTRGTESSSPSSAVDGSSQGETEDLKSAAVRLLKQDQEILGFFYGCSMQIGSAANGEGSSSQDADTSGNYVPVADWRFQTLADLKNYLESTYSDEKYIQELLETPTPDRPLFRDINGRLCMNSDMGGRGFTLYNDIESVTVTQTDDSHAQIDGLCFDLAENQTVNMRITMSQKNGRWVLDSSQDTGERSPVEQKPIENAADALGVIQSGGSLNLIGMSVYLDAPRKNLYTSSSHHEHLSTLVKALNALSLDLSSRETLEGDSSYSGSPLVYAVDVTMDSGTSHVAYFYEDGTVIFTKHTYDNAVPDERYRLKDPKALDQLRSAVEEIKASVESVPYQVSAFASPEVFSPSSEAVNIVIVNNSEKEITIGTDYSIASYDGTAIPLKDGAKPNHTGITIPANSKKTLNIDLRDYLGGQEDGGYTARFVVHDKDQNQYLFSVEYSISKESDGVSLLAMAPELQAYYDKYLSAWGFYNPFQEDFTEENYLKDFNAYLLFHSSAYLDGALDSLEQYNADANFPADVVENTIQAHFLLTKEQIRASVGPKPADNAEYSEYYDSKQQIYHFPGGYGGAGNTGYVTGARKEGNLLYLDCSWYGVDSTLSFRHTVTIRLEDDGFQYLENHVVR